MGFPTVPSGKCWKSKINWRALPRSGPKLFIGSPVEPAWAQGFSPPQQCWASPELLLEPPVLVAGPQSFCQVFCSVYSDVKFLFDHSSQASSCSFFSLRWLGASCANGTIRCAGKWSHCSAAPPLIQGPGWLWNVDEALAAPPTLPCIVCLVLPTWRSKSCQSS